MHAGCDRIELVCDYNVVEARQRARELARDLGFRLSDQAKIATAVSEVATWAMGDGGTIRFSVVRKEKHEGLVCACVGSDWPALSDRGSLVEGRTLVAGAAQLMDDFDVSLSDGGQGRQATVVMTKWLT